MIRNLTLVLSLLTVFTQTIYAQSSVGIITATLNNDSAYYCNNINVNIYGGHAFLQTYLTGNSVKVTGTTITITVGYQDPSVGSYVITAFNTTYILKLDSLNLTPGAYTVLVKYGTQTGGVSNSLTILNAARANAGADTSLCDQSTYQLNGNAIPIGATASWSIISGSGFISNNGIPNPNVTNLPYGKSEYVWSMSDANCKSKDTIAIENGEKPSKAAAEMDKFACFDSTIIHATVPTKGTGIWTLITAGANIVDVNSETSVVLNLQRPKTAFEWSVSSGSCPVERDTLIVNHDLVTDTPMITINGNLLTSTPAPAYQWYANGSAIVGATSQTYLVIANGTYKVFNSQMNCSNGMFSSEIDLVSVGVNDYNEDVLRIYPNPAEDFIQIDLASNDGRIIIRDLTNRVLINTTLRASNRIDVSSLNAGVYVVSILSNGKTNTSRLIKN